MPHGARFIRFVQVTDPSQVFGPNQVRKALSRQQHTVSRQERAKVFAPDSFPIPQPHLGRKQNPRRFLYDSKQKSREVNNNGIDPQKNAGSSKDMRSGRAGIQQIGDKRRPRIG